MAIPDDAPMGNCFRIYCGTGVIAVVRTEQAAINLINMFIWHSQATGEQAVQMEYRLAYIPDVGF